MERVAGIEPASLAWKAKVLPLNYTRIGRNPRAPWRPRQPNGRRASLQLPLDRHLHIAEPLARLGGGGWIRTSVGVSQQIYSLPPLATRAPLRRTSKYTTLLGPGPATGTGKCQ